MKKGFTLVEIMIVVAIIGIIIAIAVPAFIRARENARGRACQENLTKIDGAKEQYMLENKASNDTDFSDWTSLVMDGGTGYMKTTPECPAGGTYAINSGGSIPTCDYAEPGDWAVQHDLSTL
jgi:prepilin-type N-terminal cleavage/methylation domain-containing protein